MKFIKDQVRSQATKGLFIVSGTEFAVELAALAGFDWLILDLEHGQADEGDVLKMVRALNGHQTAPIVRIPQLRIEYIKRMLDFGASGIMCPMIETAQDARDLVDFMRYPPAGRRGLGGSTQATDYGHNFKDYFARANSDLLCIAQIETRQALDNIDAIAGIDGIDVLFIGHSDFSLNLGCFQQFESRQMIDAENQVLEAASKHGKIAGMHLKTGMDVKAYMKRGFSFMAVGTDVGCLSSACKNLARIF